MIRQKSFRVPLIYETGWQTFDGRWNDHHSPLPLNLLSSFVIEKAKQDKNISLRYRYETWEIYRKKKLSCGGVKAVPKNHYISAVFFTKTRSILPSLSLSAGKKLYDFLARNGNIIQDWNFAVSGPLPFFPSYNAQRRNGVMVSYAALRVGLVTLGLDFLLHSDWVDCLVYHFNL